MLRFFRTVLIGVLALCVFVLGILSSNLTLAAGETSTEKSFEKSRRDRKRDFEKFVKSRERSPKAEADAVAALRAARAKRLSELTKAHKDYLAKMKRYSMEEIEAKDRADEARVESLRVKQRETRKQFVATRDRLKAIDARVGDVDSYREFEIDMKSEPESKVSHSTSTSTSLEE